MSLLGALDSALSGLRATQIGIQNASNNIANAGDVNYSRKKVLTAPISLGNGGGGVGVIGFERQTNKILSVAYLGSISEQGKTGVQKEYFDAIKDTFGLSDNTTRLNTYMNQFAAAWQNMSAAPESVVRQREVLRTADQFATEIRRISGAIEDIDRRAQAEQNDKVASLNNLLDRVRLLNEQVASANSQGQPTGDLEDQRDVDIRAIAELVEIRQLDGDLGRIRLITPAGYTLLDLQATVFTFDGTSVLGNGVDVDNTMTGGRLEGLAQIREDYSPAGALTDPGREVLRKLRSQMEVLADSFLSLTGTTAGTITQADATSVAANGPAGTFTLGSSSWSAFGYGVGDQVTFAGMSAGGNNATFTITAVSGATITVTPLPTTQAADVTFSATRINSTFASAYNSAGTGTGELATGFFTGTGRFDLAVNVNLLNSTNSVKQLAPDFISRALSDSARVFTPDGLTANNTTYSGYISSIMGVISEGSNTTKARDDIANTAKTTYQERLAGFTGVNVDEELVAITTLQNSYAASARVISVVQNMFDTLEGLLR